MIYNTNRSWDKQSVKRSAFAPGERKKGNHKSVRLLPFDISWKSENRVSKSKIKFPAFASI